jgi:hypothetical protein
MGGRASFWLVKWWEVHGTSSTPNQGKKHQDPCLPACRPCALSREDAVTAITGLISAWLNHDEVDSAVPVTADVAHTTVTIVLEGRQVTVYYKKSAAFII